MKHFLKQCPAYGLTLPATYKRCRDGDTVEVTITGGMIWAIRLIGVDCPEMDTDAGKRAKKYAEHIMDESNGVLSVHVPMPKDVEHPLRSLTFDRVPGYLFIGPDHTLNEMLICCGYGKVANGWTL